MQYRCALLLLGSLVTLSGCDSPMVRDAKRLAADQLKDPGSVRFRNVRKGRNSHVCGEISGKNSFGAYPGFQRFVTIGSFVMLDEGGDTLAHFNDLWKNCPAS